MSSFTLTHEINCDEERFWQLFFDRDYNDERLVKVFVYLHDVDDTTGPLEYVPGSTLGGQYSTEWPWKLVGNDLYPPQDEFERRIGRRTLGNIVASGTDIIDRLGPQHVATGKPIVYTSADSVFQIAAHEDVIPIAEQYRICEIAFDVVARGMGVGGG